MIMFVDPNHSVYLRSLFFFFEHGEFRREFPRIAEKCETNKVKVIHLSPLSLSLKYIYLHLHLYIGTPRTVRLYLRVYTVIIKYKYYNNGRAVTRIFKKENRVPMLYIFYLRVLYIRFQTAL